VTAPDAIALAALCVATMTILTGPIGKAIAERLRGRREVRNAPALADEVERLQARVSEVEERLDFAERLLTAREEAHKLPGGAQ
jgi:F0F1-type ATP synthase membrane subunit b/b'